MNIERLQALAVVSSINKMLQANYFDICTVDAILKVLHLPAGGEIYDVLRTLHCIHYAQMPKELRDAIPEMLQAVLGVSPTYKFQTLDPVVLDVSPYKTQTAKLLNFFKGTT